MQAKVIENLCQAAEIIYRTATSQGSVILDPSLEYLDRYNIYGHARRIAFEWLVGEVKRIIAEQREVSYNGSTSSVVVSIGEGGRKPQTLGTGAAGRDTTERERIGLAEDEGRWGADAG